MAEYLDTFKNALIVFENELKKDQGRVVNLLNRIEALSREKAELEGKVGYLKEVEKQTIQSCDRHVSEAKAKIAELQEKADKNFLESKNALTRAQQAAIEAEGLRRQAENDAKLATEIKESYEKKAEALKKVME